MTRVNKWQMKKMRDIYLCSFNGHRRAYSRQ